MKKLILFLLLPLWAMAQTSNGGETEFDYGIKNNSTQTITTPPYLTTTGMDGTQGKIPSALLEKTDNKQNSLAIDGTGTKYPTVDAVNAGTTYKRTITQIRALTGTLPNTNLYTTDLGQEGNWYYDPTDVLSTDNTGTILVTSDGKRIKRIFEDGVSINWFGAKTTNTATQNTTAFDLAITWAIDNNGGKIRVPSGKYSVNPIHIPAISISTGRIIPIEITGEYMPSQLFGTIGAYPLNYSGSVIECLSTTTGESVIVVNPHPSDYGGFSGVKPIIKNLDIRTYNNSQIGGLNLRYAHQAVVENCQITNGIWSVDSSLPTYPNAVGVYTPDLDNAALTILKNVSISGFYTGLVVNEHTDGQSLNLTCNLNAMEFKQANHSSNFGMIDMQRNTVGIKFSGNHAVNIDNLNLEHAGDTQTNPNNIWQLTTYDIDDILNKGKGLINWHSVLGASGNTPNDIRLNGGNNIKYINLHENKIEVNSGDFNGEYKYNSDISTPNSRAWKTKNDSSIAGSWALQVALDLPETSFKDVITSDREGRVNFNNVTSVSNTENGVLSITRFDLNNNDGTTFGNSASFFQVNNFTYLQLKPNQTNIYAYRAGGLRLATGNSRIVFANGNADLDASTEKIGIEATGVVKIANLSGIGTRLVYSDAYGNLSAPDVPTAPTSPVGTNTTQIATMEALQAAVSVAAKWTETGNNIINNNTGAVEIKATSVNLNTNGVGAPNSVIVGDVSTGGVTVLSESGGVGIKSTGAPISINATSSIEIGNINRSQINIKSRNIDFDTTENANFTTGNFNSNSGSTQLNSAGSNININSDGSVSLYSGIEMISLGNNTNNLFIEPSTNSTIYRLPTDKQAGDYILATTDDFSKRYTVSSLPTPTGSEPVFAIVTDATAPTYLGTLTGGGSVVCPVFYDGVSWKSH